MSRLAGTDQAWLDAGGSGLEDAAALFHDRGWVALGPDAAVAEWSAVAARLAGRILADADRYPGMMRCGATWFAGTNVFPNSADGAVPEAGVPPLAGSPMRFAAQALGLSGFAWDPAQISICLPGYPQPWEGESAANLRYRIRRDGAHVDGLLRDADRRRNLGETHGFILGIPLGPADPGAAPFVVWEGSHEVMRAAFRARLGGIAPADWAREDITEAYHAARRTVFETCRRVEIIVPPGQCYVAHRLVLHGVAPWTAPPGPPRAIAYFRPDPFPGALPDWWLDRA